MVATQARLLEGDPRDARDLVLVVDHRVPAAAKPTLLAAPPRLAEVDAAGQLAHDEQVDALDDLAPQRRGIGEPGDDGRGPQVREEAEILADAQQPLLGAHVDGERVPLRPADRAEQHRPAVAADVDDLVAQRRAVGVDRGAADQLLDELEREALPGRDRLEHAAGLHDHLGADAVSGQQGRCDSRGAPLDLCGVGDSVEGRGRVATAGRDPGQMPLGSSALWRFLCHSSLLIACT